MAAYFKVKAALDMARSAFETKKNLFVKLLMTILE